MSFDRLFNLNVEETLSLLQEKKVLKDKDSIYCVNCFAKSEDKVAMVWSRRDCVDKYQWRCKRCRTWLTGRHGSFLEGARKPITHYLKLILYWVLLTTNVATALATGFCENTVSDYFHRFRYVVRMDYDRKKFKLGGEGVIVEIDESLFCRVKHGKGRDLKRKPVWVFGIRERYSGKCYFEIVSSRDKNNLLRIIYERVERGSFIMSDCWKAYDDIVKLGKDYKHDKVNHTYNFVKPEKKGKGEASEKGETSEKVHTNGIESLWNSAKRKFKQMIGCKRGYVQAYLTEFCWRNAFQNDKEAILEGFFDALARFGTHKLDWDEKFEDYFVDQDSGDWILDDDGAEISEKELEELLKDQEIPISDLKEQNAFTDYRYNSKNSVIESDESEIEDVVQQIQRRERYEKFTSIKEQVVESSSQKDDFAIRMEQLAIEKEQEKQAKKKAKKQADCSRTPYLTRRRAKKQ